MAVKKTHIPGFEAFEHYYSGEMSAADQHLFEKQMLDDPAFADAYEGFLALKDSGVELSGIREGLEGRLASRIATAKKKSVPLWGYGAAASVVIAFFALWLAYTGNMEHRDLERSAPHLVETPILEPDKLAANQPEAIVKPATPRQLPSTAPMVPKRNDRSQKKVDNDPAMEADEAVAVQAETSSDEPAVSLPEQPNLAYSGKNNATVPASAARSAPAKPLADAVVIGETTARKMSAAAPVQTETTLASLSPVPLMGWESYNLYLSQNAGQVRSNGEVTVHFKVNADGSLSDFTANGKKKLQAEAIRIVREGPVWVPVKQNGVTFSMPVSVMVRFKK